MIEDQSLCASRDEDTGEWLVQSACVRAQMAEAELEGTDIGARHLATFDSELVDHLVHEMHESFAANDWEGVVTFPRKDPQEVIAQFFAQRSPHYAHGVFDVAARQEELPAGAAIPIDAELFDRAAITAKNVESLMDSLDFATVRLEGAMYRVGYLEGQVASLEEQLKVLPEYRSRAAGAILTERENVLLHDQVQKLLEKTAGYESMIDTLDLEIGELDDKLTASNAILDRLQTLWWFRLFSWLFGFQIS
jgi:hypothetical protein